MDLHIRAHLRHVVGALRAEATADPSRARERAALLDVLEGYAERGRYPRWSRPISPRRRPRTPPRAFGGPGVRAPLFRDDAGTWCAVGHLIAHSDRALADAIAVAYGPCWLAEIDDERLGAWAAAHGFTVDELAWIQPSYCYQPPVCDEVPALEAVDPFGQSCEGPDPRLHVHEGVWWYCQDCDGPFRAWITVQNPGTEDASAAVELLAGDGRVLDRVEGLSVAGGEGVLVELTTGSVEDVSGGGIRLVASADCDPVGDEFTAWDLGNGGVGWVLPDACGGTCDSGLGETGGLGEAGGQGGLFGPGPVSCGCASTGSGAGWWPLLGVGLVRRRRSRAR